MTGKLTVGSDGRVHGPIKITFNEPWPCRNGYASGFASPAHGVVIHTEDGYEAGTISWFNNPAAKASAFFSVGADGAVHQYGPVGHGWCSWAQSQGNATFYSIEDSDNTHPSVPFTAAQITSLAQLAEVLSRHDGFPLQAATNPLAGDRGVALHSEGGQAWGGHLSCPGPVRGAQRAEVIALAIAIRAGIPQKGDTMHGLPGTVLSVQMLGTEGIAKDDVQVWSTDGHDLYVVRWSAATGKWGTVSKVG